MTRKTLFSSGEAQTTSQAQQVPRRRPYENSNDDPSRYDEDRGFRNGVQETTDCLSTGRTSTVRHDNLEALPSPATDAVTSPSVGHLSYSEALSPASAFTPSALYSTPSSTQHQQQPTRKRARTASNSDSTIQVGDIGRRKNDLAGLLNPIEDESPVYSPRLKISLFDNPQSNMLDHEAQADPMVVANSLSVRLASSRPFVDIQPRPPGHDVQMEDAPDLEKRADGEDFKRKGRKGPLESDQRRAEVLEVREMGACLRCHIMRIRCTANKDEACSNCKATLEKARKWEIPCTREWLRSRWQCLIPDMLLQRHNPEKSIPNIPTLYLGQSFKLPLTHRSGFKFEIDARIVRVSAETKANFDNFTYDQEGNDTNARMFLETSAGWPLVPTMRPGQLSYDHTVRMLSHHLETQKEQSSMRWVASFLPAQRGQKWAREVLQMVVYFQNEVSQSRVLRKGFDILFIRFLMNHTFFIPQDRLTEVNNELPPDDQRSWDQIRQIRERGDEECPKYVNRWLKSALLKIFEKHLPDFFQEVEALFKLQETTGDQAKLSSLDRDEAFAALILVLMLIATAQVKILQAGIAWDRELPPRTEPYLKASAREAIYEMESKLVDHCLSLYKYRFHKQTMKGKVSADRLPTAEKAVKFNIIEEFEKFKLQHEDGVADISTKLDASEENEHLFMSHNHTRLLLRLGESIWRPKSQRR